MSFPRVRARWVSGALVLALSSPIGASIPSVEAEALESTLSAPKVEAEVPSPPPPGAAWAPEVEIPALPGESSPAPAVGESIPPPVPEKGQSGSAGSTSGSGGPSAHAAMRESSSVAAPAVTPAPSTPPHAIRGNPRRARGPDRKAGPVRRLSVGRTASGPVIRGGPAASPSIAHSRLARHASNTLDAIGGHIPLPLPVPDWSKPIILALLLLVVVLAGRSRLVAYRTRGLERQRAALLRDVGVMQSALVPKVPAQIGGLTVSVAYRPAEGPAAGGDFYDLFVTKPGRVAVILGDVAGHGPEALSQAALTRYTLRAYLQAGLQPRAAIALAGQALVDPSGAHFATVIVGLYDSSSGKLTCASAGHPPPILLGTPTHELSSVCSCPPIGWGIPTGRRQTTISLGQGARVCFFSDGLIEARSAGTLLGRERLAEILENLGPHPTATALLQRVRAAADATRDDMAACIFSPLAGASGVLIHEEEIEVDVRSIGGPHLPRLLAVCGVCAADIARSLAIADGIAASLGTAVLRVTITPSGAMIAVAPPGFGAAEQAFGDHSEPAAPPASRPLLRVVPGGEEPEGPEIS